MNTKVIFNLPVSVKKAAARRAKRNGITLSTVLSRAAQAYGSGVLDVEMVDTRPLRPAVARSLKKAIEDFERGVNISPAFSSAAEGRAYLEKQVTKRSR